MKIRKKPVVVDAFLFNGTNQFAVMRWASEVARGRLHWDINEDGTIGIRTIEGTMLATAGDWIICGIKGEFYPCKPDIFEATYERLDDYDH